nr:hypothetical protein [Allosalinactinospora lopnorensis]
MRRRAAATCTTTGFALLLAVGLAPPAFADHEEMPTARQLLEKCDNGTDKCVFHPKGTPEYHQDASEVVGNPVYNCTDRKQTTIVEWSDTKTESNSIGLSMTTTFGVIFKVAFKVSYGHSWSESHTESQSTFVDAPPGHVARVYRGAMMQKVNGTYELHFGDRYHGHYYWYVPFEATGPAKEKSGTVTQSATPMTEEERAAHCD